MKRRYFLRTVPVVAVSSGFLLKACETDNSTAPVDGAGDPSDAGSLITQAANDEATVIKTYEFAQDSGIIVTSELVEIAERNLSHHMTHLASLNGWLTNNQQPTVSLDGAQPAPGVDSLATENEITQFAMELEFAAAGFYFNRIQLTSGVAREIFSDLFPIEFGHVIEYKQYLNLEPAIDNGLFRSVTLGGAG